MIICLFNCSLLFLLLLLGYSFGQEAPFDFSCDPFRTNLSYGETKVLLAGVFMGCAVVLCAAAAIRGPIGVRGPDPPPPLPHAARSARSPRVGFA